MRVRKGLLFSSNSRTIRSTPEKRKGKMRPLVAACGRRGSQQRCSPVASSHDNESMVERKFRVLGFSLLFVALLSLVPAAAITIQGPTRTPKSKTKVSETTTAKRRVAKLRHHRRHRYYERFYTSSFADDVTTGDVTAGEDPIVRAAAIDALGNMNGTVVAIEPTSGRILAMVNQKLALAEGAQPCSTFKVAVALAALNEKLITPETQIKL